MADSTRKKLLDATLKALIAAVEPKMLKVPATFIAELLARFGDLPDKQSAALIESRETELRESLARLIPTSTNAALAAAGVDRLYRLLADFLQENELTQTEGEPALRVSISHLPTTGQHLIGRATELRQLSTAWRSKSIKVMSIVAWGGVGKSALVNHWLTRLSADDYRGARRVFGWTFYRHGLSGESACADEFIDAALRWFGDRMPEFGSPWSKGERLARLIRQEPTLLILDGLEPLQNPPGPSEGRLKDVAMRALIREVAIDNNGLCLITTRLPIADIEDIGSGTARQLDLEHLSPSDGATLLRRMGVWSTNDDDFELASGEFDGHCLALTLLSSLLVDGYDGDLRRRDVVPSLEGDVRYGMQARRVMVSYENWFGEAPEIAVLRMLSLFDREADQEALSSLKARPPIQGLTEQINGLKASEWRSTLMRLRRAHLLAPENPFRPGSLDIHPLVRDHFGEQLRTHRLDAWKEGNRRLFSYVRKSAVEVPRNVQDVSKLCSGVIHACAAGLYREALHDLFLNRIQRGTRGHFHSTDMLGTFSLNIAALSHFLKNPGAVSLAACHSQMPRRF